MQLTSPKTLQRLTWRERVSRLVDCLASTSGMLIGCGIALEILAVTTFPDPRLHGLPIRAPIAILCGIGGGFGLSAIFLRPSSSTRQIVSVCLMLAATLRAVTFTYVSVRDDFSTVLTLAPIATMTFPFLLGVMLWRRAHTIGTAPYEEDM